MTLAAITARLADHRLAVLGGFHPTPEDALPALAQTVLLIGPGQGDYWSHVTAQPEWHDGRADPIDRWSRRVIGRLACDLRGKALFPFGGPPYHPFIAWAKRSGRAWESPVRLLVHDKAGLWVSYRGAVLLRARIALPPAGPRPCDACEKPCLTACPAQALTAKGYNVPNCHDWLDQNGENCLSGGCAVRRACPLSISHGRVEEHSAYHMRQFHK